jgi:hypothetical protein
MGGSSNRPMFQGIPKGSRATKRPKVGGAGGLSVIRRYPGRPVRASVQAWGSPASLVCTGCLSPRRSSTNRRPFSVTTMSAPGSSRCRRRALHQTISRRLPGPRPVGRSVRRPQPTLDDLPGAFRRRFIVQRIGRIVYDLSVVPPPGTLGTDDRFHGFRLRGPLLWRAFRRAGGDDAGHGGRLRHQPRQSLSPG